MLEAIRLNIVFALAKIGWSPRDELLTLGFSEMPMQRLSQLSLGPNFRNTQCEFVVGP